jgi:acyl-CoA thioester hydrolase
MDHAPPPPTALAAIPQRTDYKVFRAIATRWMDNDVYGHVNNVVYYSYFDTAVNGYLLEASGADIRQMPAIGVVAETQCRFLKSVSFPEALEIGLRVERLGRSSVVYGLGVFRCGEADPAAVGRFVHVYVDARTRSSVPLPDAIRVAVTPLL